MDFWGQVWKRVWEMAFFGQKLGLDWRCGRHAPTKNSKEYPPRGGGAKLYLASDLYYTVCEQLSKSRAYPHFDTVWPPPPLKNPGYALCDIPNDFSDENWTIRDGENTDLAGFLCKITSKKTLDLNLLSLFSLVFSNHDSFRLTNVLYQLYIYISYATIHSDKYSYFKHYTWKSDFSA